MASELRINKVNSDAKKVTIATSAAFHATDLPSWKSTCELTVEGRRLFVHNATTLAQKLAPLKSTCESIQEKIPIVECSATIPVQGRVFSSNTCSLIQEKNNFSALSTYLPLQEGKSSKSTCQLIQGKSISAVTSATIYATMLEVSRDISSSILVKNPMHAISAVSLAAI